MLAEYSDHAHNNLGVVYLGQQKLYEASGEFEWASGKTQIRPVGNV